MSQSIDPPDQHHPGAHLGGRKCGTAVTRVDLIDAVYQKVGLSRQDSARLVELVLKEITECLERGETVKLSSFGSVIVRSKGARTGRNVNTRGTMTPHPGNALVL